MKKWNRFFDRFLFSSSSKAKFPVLPKPATNTFRTVTSSLFPSLEMHGASTYVHVPNSHFMYSTTIKLTSSSTSYRRTSVWTVNICKLVLLDLNKEERSSGISFLSPATIFISNTTLAPSVDRRRTGFLHCHFISFQFIIIAPITIQMNWNGNEPWQVEYGKSMGTTDIFVVHFKMRWVTVQHTA